LKFNDEAYTFGSGTSPLQFSRMLGSEEASEGRDLEIMQDPENVMDAMSRTQSNWDKAGNAIARTVGAELVGGTLEALGSGNILGAIKTAGSAYYTFKDRDLKQTAKQELLNGAQSALTNPNVTRNISAFFQKVGSTAATTGTAGAPTTGADTNVTTRPTRLAGGQVNSSGATSYPANLGQSITRRSL
jgi:hypothetical protein